MFRGELVPCYEKVSRVENVLEELQLRRFGTIRTPQRYDDALLHKVHTPRYIEFLRGAWQEWVALDSANEGRDAFPSAWPVRSFRTDILPVNFAARMGLFSFDAGTPLTAGTWRAAQSGAWCALAATQHVLEGAPATFALTRPPGHHAGADFFGGYCFINNAALAAQHLRDAGLARIAVLDIDYHHGNGTQAIFYDRADVFFASIHGDPSTEYPFYLGYADESGAGAGRGFNLNLPLPCGSDFATWRIALGQALQAISDFRAEALVVSLGVDTYEGDPISGFKLRTDDYFAVGADIARSGLPVVFVFEGGYAVNHIGINTVNLLEGFELSRV